MKWGIAVFISALALGMISGLSSGRSGGPSKPVAPDHERTVSAPGRPMWTSDDFAGLIRGHTAALKSRDYLPGIELDLADWSDAEIRAALDESLSDPFCMAGRGRELVIGLLEEWLERDFDAAFE